MSTYFIIQILLHKRLVVTKRIANLPKEDLRLCLDIGIELIKSFVLYFMSNNCVFSSRIFIFFNVQQLFRMKKSSI